MEKQSIEWSIYRYKNISSNHYSTRDISVRKLICPEIDDLLYNSQLLTQKQYFAYYSSIIVNH